MGKHGPFLYFKSFAPPMYFCLHATTTSLAFETIYEDDTDPSPSYV
jgi:hypothetical protein